MGRATSIARPRRTGEVGGTSASSGLANERANRAAEDSVCEKGSGLQHVPVRSASHFLRRKGYQAVAVAVLIVANGVARALM